MVRQRTMIFLSALALVLGACDKSKEGPRESYILIFLPRECTAMQITPLKDSVLSTVGKDGKTVSWHSEESIDNGSVAADKFILTLKTFSEDGKTTANITDLETQLDHDYRRSRATKSSEDADLVMTKANLVNWEYRVTGVKDFKIIALSQLFGQPAGTSLNKYFKIHRFDPKQIISYRTKDLIWGYSDEEEIENIALWLSLEPMAPPAIYFRFNTIPAEIPADVEFVAVLETTDNKVLRDTLQVRLKLIDE